MNINSKIYELVKEIPAGRVVTYGQIAKVIKTGPRVVGNVLHKNPNPSEIPCHRVVNAKGLTAANYAFGGNISQEERLRGEGVKLNNGKIDLSVYGFDL